MFDATNAQKIYQLANTVGKSNDVQDQAAAHVRIQTLPESTSYLDIRGLPPKLVEPFRELQENVAQKKLASSILQTARACLDVALKELNELSGSRKERIKNLRDTGIITVGLETWANRLWKDGSDAVHDLDASRDNAVEHVEFLKLFFQVVFALPRQIEEAKEHATSA